MNDIEQKIRELFPHPEYVESNIKALADLFRSEVRSILDEIREAEINNDSVVPEDGGIQALRKIQEIRNRYC